MKYVERIVEMLTSAQEDSGLLIYWFSSDLYYLALKN